MLPATLAAGDHLVIVGDALEPVEHTDSQTSPGGDWAILRAIAVSFGLTIDTANENIPMRAFYNDDWSPNTSLTSVSLPTAETIGVLAFWVCWSLASISLPVAETIGVGAFWDCSSLASISLPVADTIGAFAFASCWSLTSVSLPVATTVGDYAFGGCTSLTSASLPAATTIKDYAFVDCYDLRFVILRADGALPITTTGDVFDQTPSGILFVTTKGNIGDLFSDPSSLNNPQILTMTADAIDALASAGAYVRSADAGGNVVLENILTPAGTVGYQWYDGDDTAIANATNDTYTANVSGVYTMKVVSNDVNGIAVTYALPSNRVVIGSAPTIAGAENKNYRTGNLAMAETFTLTGSDISLGVSSPLSSISATHNGNSVTLAGDLPDETAEYIFTLYATNPYAYWTGENKKFTHLVNVTAVRTVTFESNGGSAVNPISADVGGVISEDARPADPTKDNYNLAGWHKDVELTEPWNFTTDTVPGDITLYADWTELPVYTVTFNSMGGTDVGSIPVREGRTIQRPTDPTYTGHTFDGWYADAATTIPWDFDNDAVTEDITLYAKWTEAPPVQIFTVTFNTNGGTPVPNAQTVASGDLATRPTTNPTKSGYTFAGWYKESTHTTAWNFATDIVVENITLYAKWTAKSDDDDDPTRYRGSGGCANGAGGLLALFAIAVLPSVARRERSETNRG